MKITDNILQIVLGKIQGERKREFFSHLDKDDKARDEFRQIKNVWALTSSKKSMSDYRVEKLYLDFKHVLIGQQKNFIAPVHRDIQITIKREQKQSRLSLSGESSLRAAKYAAIFILAIGISSLFFYMQTYHFTKSGTGVHVTSVFADNAQISKIILPDSTVVWLNSGTKISYNNNYALDNREITLTGQAFFQVTKNERIPLKVICKNLEVRVLGTRFDVSAYPEDKNISVVLESGQVEMFNTGIKGAPYKMKPGEMVHYDTATGSMYSENVNPENFTSWKEGVLIFRNEPITGVITKLQRKYDIDIEVRHPEIYNSLFTATIKNETLEEIVKSISYACSVQYEIVESDNLNTRIKVILTKK